MKLVIVDDTPDDAMLAQAILRREGHSVELFHSIRDFKRAVQRDTYDLLFLDWVMPEATGIEVLEWLKENGPPALPVIMVSAKDNSADIVTALDAGADDYITKPLDEGVLIARVKALARRVHTTKTSNRVLVKSIELIPSAEVALVNGEKVELSTMEFRLALMLLDNLGRPLSRTYLLETIWGRNREVVTRTLDVHVSKIRAKLNLHPENGFRLYNIYGYGYRLGLIDE